MISNLELIETCLKQIRYQQKVDGSFTSLSVSGDGQSSVSYSTTFFTSLILSSLAGIPEAKSICLKAANFLLSEKSIGGSFNYWSSSSPEKKIKPYPDDLDDTFCGLSAIYAFDRSLLSGADLAKAIKILTHQEIALGGPYKTWITERKEENWNDVDLAVNSNIGFFLAQHKILLPNLSDFTENKISNNQIKSPYYPTIYPIIYFISRWYQGNLKDKLIRQLWLLKRENTWGNILNQTLALNALCNFGCLNLKSELDLLKLNIKEIEGFCAFCYDPTLNDQKYFAGCSALNAALLAELFSKVEKYLIPTNDIHDKFLLVKEKTTELLRDYSNINEDALVQAISRMECSSEDVYITILPLLIARDFSSFRQTEILELAVYNFLGCILYRLFDDEQDENHHNEQTKIIAAACSEKMKNIIETKNNQKFESFSVLIIEQMNRANIWEKENLKKTVAGESILMDHLPPFWDFTHLAQKSLGYVIASAGVIFLAGRDSEENINTICKFFEHYIVARQLNDDAHDWEEDLRGGIINYASFLILKRFRQDIFPYQLKIENNIQELRKIFWNEVLSQVSSDILFHVDQAQKILYDMDFIKNKQMFFAMLEPSKKAAETALKECARTKEFIKEYSKI